MENSLKPGCLQGTESESEINEASKHIAISNVTVTFEGERCFHTVLTTEENAPTTVTEMSDTTLEIRTSDLKSTALESVESRCVRQGNSGDAKMRGNVRECHALKSLQLGHLLLQGLRRRYKIIEHGIVNS